MVDWGCLRLSVLCDLHMIVLDAIVICFHHDHLFPHQLHLPLQSVYYFILLVQPLLELLDLLPSFSHRSDLHGKALLRRRRGICSVI